MQFASALYGQVLPFAAPVEDLMSASEVDGGEVLQALVRVRVVVSLDEDADLSLEVGGVGVVVEQGPVLHGLMGYASVSFSRKFGSINL